MVTSTFLKYTLPWIHRMYHYTHKFFFFLKEIQKIAELLIHAVKKIGLSKQEGL